MNILHASDLHGSILPLIRARHRVTPDLFVLSGDVLPNTTRGDAACEVPYQSAWVRDYAPIFRKVFGDLPVLVAPGNHDYADLAGLLLDLGVNAFPLVDEDGQPLAHDVDGERFVGLRQIPYLAGEWAGEEHDLRPWTEAALALDPTVLVAHCPPSGMLDGVSHGHVGNSVLATSLAYRPHQVRLVLTGHVHEQGGKTAVFDGSGGPVTVVNSATTCTLVSVAAGEIFVLSLDK